MPKVCVKNVYNQCSNWCISCGIVSTQPSTLALSHRTGWVQVTNYTHNIPRLSAWFSTIKSSLLPHSEQGFYPFSTAPITKTTILKKERN